MEGTNDRNDLEYVNERIAANGLRLAVYTWQVINGCGQLNTDRPLYEVLRFLINAFLQTVGSYGANDSTIGAYCL